MRPRRIFALLLDLVLVSILAAVLWTALFIVTFGLSWFFVPPLFPLVAFFYNGLTVSGAKMAMPGMFPARGTSIGVASSSSARRRRLCGGPIC